MALEGRSIASGPGLTIPRTTEFAQSYYQQSIPSQGGESYDETIYVPEEHACQSDATRTSLDPCRSPRGGTPPAWAQTVLTSCGTITSPGNYRVGNDLTTSGTCFTVQANNVGLD